MNKLIKMSDQFSTTLKKFNIPRTIAKSLEISPEILSFLERNVIICSVTSVDAFVLTNRNNNAKIRT